MDEVATIRTVGHVLAAQAVSAAVAKGRELGYSVVAAVVGGGAELVALLRASGAPFVSSQIAQDKAHTAASFRAPTPQVYQMVRDNPALSAGLSSRPGVALFGGGLPIVIEGEFVGAIGVSGASEELDIVCAKAGLSAIGGALD